MKGLILMHKRKYILTILSIILCFALTACGIEATKPTDKTETSETVKPSESETEGSQTTVEEPISEEEKGNQLKQNLSTTEFITVGTKFSKSTLTLVLTANLPSTKITASLFS